MKFKTIFSLYISLMLLAGCSNSAITNAESIKSLPKLFPDYAGITIPPNIAPLNFLIEEVGDQFQVQISGKKGTAICVTGSNDIQIPSKAWRSLLQANRGDSIVFRVFAKQEGNWKQYESFVQHIAEEEIDRYLSYRLIEPGYRYWREMGIYQRDLEGFNEECIYTNQGQDGDLGNKQCMNCHAFQSNSTDRFMFHLRTGKGGTIIYDNGKYHKLNIKTDELISGAVYPSWHPTKNIIAFSVNNISQLFHTNNEEKVEVFDSFSDLVLFDVAQQKVIPICKTDSLLETYPSWSPDGKWLYYCGTSNLPTYQDSKAHNEAIEREFQQIHYHLIRLPFDETTLSFGAPDTIVRIRNTKASVTFPRVSPDGRFVLFSASDYGTFSIWHDSADLYALDLEKKHMFPLSAANSERAESYHSWSSNSRWIVFSSRRIDGQYTRSFITYMNKEGVAQKAFLLPQQSATHNQSFYKAYNIPELTKEKVKTTYREIERMAGLEAQTIRK